MSKKILRGSELKIFRIPPIQNTSFVDFVIIHAPKELLVLRFSFIQKAYASTFRGLRLASRTRKHEMPFKKILMVQLWAQFGVEPKNILYPTNQQKNALLML